MKNPKILGLILVVSLAFVLSGLAQQAGEETVTCPVTGKVLKRSEAKANYEYQGATYYFCCQGCKEKFVKDPGQFLQPQEETNEVYSCPMHPEIRSDRPGKCPECGMNLVKKAPAPGQGTAVPEERNCCCLPSRQGAVGQTSALPCPLCSTDVEMKVENVPGGVSVTMTSKNPGTANRIREYFAGRKMPCPGTSPVQQQQDKK